MSKTKIKALDMELSVIADQIKKVVTDHDSCVPSVTEDQLFEMLHSVPIQSLRESLDFFYGKEIKKFSLKEMKKMSSLRKEKENLIGKYDLKECEFNIAIIEDIQKKINKIIKKKK